MTTQRKTIDARYVEAMAKFFAERAEENEQQAEDFRGNLDDIADWHEGRAQAYQICHNLVQQYLDLLAK